MDESERRRERLEALRAQASTNSLAPSASPTPLPFLLPNPLLGPRSPTSLEFSTPRFNFYTNPMSAISGTKRKDPCSILDISASCSQSPCIAVIPSLPIVNQTPYQSPRHGPPPPGSPWVGGDPGRGPTTAQYHGRSWGGQPWRGIGPRWQVMGPGGGPSAWNRPSSASSSHGFPPYQSRGGVYGRPNFGSVGQGRGSQYSGNTTGLGYGGGGLSGGRGGRGDFHRRGGSDKLHIKCMTKDPWRKLTPIIGSILPGGSSDNWLPKSLEVGGRKGENTESALRSALKQSLSEYLALSFEEAVNEKTQQW